mgnify:CR=1 FL=1
MSTVEHIEDEIRNMSPDELARFRKWFLELDSRQWDEEIEQDVKAGNLDKIAEQALQSWGDGKATEPSA